MRSSLLFFFSVPCRHRVKDVIESSEYRDADEGWCISTDSVNDAEGIVREVEGLGAEEEELIICGTSVVSDHAKVTKTPSKNAEEEDEYADMMDYDQGVVEADEVGEQNNTRSIFIQLKSHLLPLS